MPKTIIPLTDAKCRAAKYNETGSNKLFDGGGLYLDTPKTGAKRWRLRFKQPNGKESLITLGEYPAMPLTEARALRAEMRKKIASGIDIVVERDAQRADVMANAEITFEKIANEWVETRISGWSEKHLQKCRGIFKNDIFPAIGSRPVTSLIGADILKAIQKIEKRGAYEMAHKALEFVGGVLRYAAGTGRITGDITYGLKSLLRPKPAPKHHPHVSDDDLPSLLCAINNYSGLIETKIAIKIMMLTFQRTNEMRWAEWGEFDFDKKEWCIPATRMKGSIRRKNSGHDQIVPLANQTLVLLKDLHKITGNYKFLFPGARNPKYQAMSAETINKALKSLGFEGKQTGHGFRGLASTILNEKSGFHADAIERQLAHTEENKIRGAYNHAKHIEERHRLMQWWADYLESKGLNQVDCIDQN